METIPSSCDRHW